MRTFFVFIFALIMAGCGGKVQTNPLPDNKKFYLPSTEKTVIPKEQIHYKEDFDRYARKVLNITDQPSTQEENIDIFSIGYAKEKLKK